MAAARNRVRLTEDERRKFDDIGLDEINQMTDVSALNKLRRYMECVPENRHRENATCIVRLRPPKRRSPTQSTRPPAKQISCRSVPG